MFDKETVESIVNLGAKAPSVVSISGECDPVICIPHNQKVVSLAEFCPPTRIKQRPEFLEAGSFADYVNRFKTAETLIFAAVTETGVSFLAVLDYHGAAPGLDPAFCSHVATFAAIETPEWKVLNANDRKVMDQIAFANFVEDNMGLFTAGTDEKYPTGAVLLELVKSLHGHANARWERVWNPTTGAHTVKYDEEIEVSASRSQASGTLPVPNMICGGAAMFQGGTVFEIPARLKTRTADRKLGLMFEIERKPQFIRTSIMQLVKQIADTTKIVPLLGKP